MRFAREILLRNVKCLRAWVDLFLFTVRAKPSQSASLTALPEGEPSKVFCIFLKKNHVFLQAEAGAVFAPAYCICPGFCAAADIQLFEIFSALFVNFVEKFVVIY